MTTTTDDENHDSKTTTVPRDGEWFEKRVAEILGHLQHGDIDHDTAHADIQDAYESCTNEQNRSTPSTEADARVLYAVVNDNPTGSLAANPLVLCGDAADQLGIFESKDEAVEKRDKLREEAGNPAINVYHLAVTPLNDGESSE